MNHLTQYLIKELSPDQRTKRPKKVGIYAGSFKPPTNGHYKVVTQALADNPDLDELRVLIGTGKRDGIDQAQSMLIWDIYKKYLPYKVILEPVSKPPIRAVYDFAKENPEVEVDWILGAREGNEEDFTDIAKRTKAADNYPNITLRTTVTDSGASGTAARNAYKVSQEKLEKLLPIKLSQADKDEIYNILNRTISENKKNCGCGQNPCITYGNINEDDPKKGTGKKPKGSDRRLYTDEDPKDTVGIKFSTRQDIVDTLSKKSFKAKSHARQSQIINLIHQRVRAALGRTKDPAKKKKLKSGFEYIKKRKETSKKKTQRLKKQKLNEVLNPKTFDFKPLIKSLTSSMEKDGLLLKPYPKIIFVHNEEANADDFFGKTAYYDPSNNEVVLYTLGRHPKDIMRSYAHELIHVHQNHEDRLHDIKTDNINADKHLENLEREAYETGNIMFRSWTNNITENKDPFGLNAYAYDLARLNEDEEPWYIYVDMDGVVADFDKRFEDLSGMLPQSFVDKNGLKAFWDLIDEKHKVAFWRGIEIMPGAEKLISFVSKYPYEMLTAPSIKKQSIIGKGLWVKDKIGTLYPSKPKVTYRPAKLKHTVKPNLTKYDILIDDKKSTIDNWNSAGGTAIFYVNADQVIDELKNLGL